ILNSASDTTASTRSTSSTTSGTTQSTAYASSATEFSTESSTAWSRITFDTSQTTETTTQFDENCITYTHFGDVQFDSVGGTFPATKLDKTRLDDFITIEDLHHCKKECASIAGCYQIYYSADGCYIFGGLEEAEGKTFSTKLDNCEYYVPLKSYLEIEYEYNNKTKEENYQIFNEKNTSDWDLLAYAQLDLFSEIGDYAYAYTSNFTHSLATSVPEEYPVALNNSFYLQIDGGFYFRWTTTIDNVTPSKSAIDEEISWTSWISVQTYINEFFYDIFYDGEFFFINYEIAPEQGDIEIIAGEYPELEGECISDTHFGDIIFYPLGEFSFPVTSIDAATVNDTTVSDLKTCQNQCVSYAGCYQMHYSDDTCSLFNDVPQVADETFSTNIESCDSSYTYAKDSIIFKQFTFKNSDANPI
ncbi:unnamed protein product, partial [Oikopleura dioica]